MLCENEDKAMRALCVGSGGSPRWRVFASSVRGSHVRPLFWLQMLLVLLLAGKASCNQTSSVSPTTAQASVQYVIDVTVDVTGPGKEESEIKAWLVAVFQNRLESCLSPGNLTTTVTPNHTQTTTATTQVTTQNNATTETTPVTINNATTETTPVTINNATINNATTETTPVTINNATINNATTETTPVTINNATINNATTETTPVTINNATINNATTETTPVTINNTTTARSTLENNSTTTAVTPTTLDNNTTTAVTPTTLDNNTTTAVTPTTLDNNTTTAVTPTTSDNNTTTATTPTTSDNNTTTTTESSTTTAATESAAIPQAKSNQPATPTPKGNTKSSAPTSRSSTQDKSSTASSPSTSSASTTPSIGNTNGKRKRSLRRARDVGSNGTQSSGIGDSTTTGLFQNVDILCSTNTSMINATCTVTLQLKQTVPACCILRSLCAASNTSSNISVVGTTVYKDPPQNVCNSNLQEDSCAYTGPINKSCGDSKTAYVAGPSNCGQVLVTNTCSCSPYCNKTDAYYTFQMSILNPELNNSYVSSLISQKIEQAKNCTQSSNGSCPLFDIRVKYKDASVICGVKVTNRQNCSVILHFVSEVPICVVAAVMTDLFQSQNQITYGGSVTRAAICGESSDPSSLLTSQLTWINLSVDPVAFCGAINELNSFVCKDGGNLVVLLAEQCAQTLSTSAGPSVTITQSNTNNPPVNTTSKSPNGTTTAANVTVTTTLNTPTTTGSGFVTPSVTPGTNETAESQANALLDLTKDMSKLNSSQINQLVSQLESLLSGPNVSLALGNTSVNIVSNLLNASPEKLTSSSNRIIKIVDAVGLKLVLGSAAESLLSPSVALSVKPVDGSNFQETSFSISDPSNVQVRDITRMRRSVAAASSIPQGAITLPSSITQNLTPDQKQQATRVQFNFYQKSTVFQDKSLGQRRLNSGILGASVANLSITGLKDNVVIYLRNTAPVPANYVASCVFWDFALNSGSGGWNPTGCVVQNSTDNMTVCGCNHLTSFAILLDISRQGIISPLQDTILTYITYIGCGISAIFLSVTLLTYLAFENLRKDIPSKILIQLCFALLLLNLVFLVDAWLALYTHAEGLCISTAWFLHYFLLVSFTWMGLEAVHMYNALVKVFNTNISRYMLKFSVVGWGVPMIVVIIVIAINKDNYGLVSYGKYTDGVSDDFCWLKNDIAFYVAVVAYFCVIFLFNLIMFIVVLVQLSRIKRQNPQNLRHRSTLEDMCSLAGITVLLGLTWGFAFFAWGPVNLAFMYLFAIFNSFQGLFIFVFYCALKENVKRQWRIHLCCGKLRLLENSEWSSTATQKTMKKSLNNIKSSKSSQSNSPSISTSFLTTDSSEQSSGISSPFDDRVVTADEDASMDVVLNEINSQYRQRDLKRE